jgi:hypothetical protein
MIYIYRPQFSQGARELATALNGTTLRRYENGRFRTRRVGGAPVEVRSGDTLVCWGISTPGLANSNGIKILNGGAIRSKLTDAQVLRTAGVPTIEISPTRPTQELVQVVQQVVDPALAIWEDVKESAEDLVDVQFSRTPVMDTAIIELRGQLARLQTALTQPPPAAVVAPRVEWLARSSSHVGGEDLLHPPVNPDFWVRKENLTHEYRIHSFLGKSIRAGIKAPRVGVAQHAWIRSFDAGWFINYENFESTKEQRDLAHAAVKALGLQFGAVDIGRKSNGTFIVLEVNRAPGLEGGTVTAYANAIRKTEEKV